MNTQQSPVTMRPGLIVTMITSSEIQQDFPNREEDQSHENLPPNQPEVDPRREENPELGEEQEWDEQQEVEADPLETPVPDLDEIDPDGDEDLDSEITPENPEEYPGAQEEDEKFI